MSVVPSSQPGARAPELPGVEVAERFQDAASWWASTQGADGPHAVPVWGVVVDGRPYFYGAASTVRSRNLAADPRLVLHLESADDVLLVHGRARPTGPAGGDPAVNAAYAAKYTAPDDEQYLPDAPLNAGSLLWVVEPERAVAWLLSGSEDWVTRRWHA